MHEKPGQAQRGGGSTVTIHSQPGAIRRRWVAAPRFGHFYLGKDPVPIYCTGG